MPNPISSKLIFFTGKSGQVESCFPSAVPRIGIIDHAPNFTQLFEVKRETLSIAVYGYELIQSWHIHI